jgi:cell division protein FtsB
MNLLGEIRRRAHHIVGPVAGITLFGYFAYHIVQGDRGLIAWLKLSQQVETTQLQYDEVVAKRAEISHRVGLLQLQSLDPDLLEERARGVLGLVHPDDIIIMEGAWSAVSADMTAPVSRPAPTLSRGVDRRALDDLINTTLDR